MAFADLHQKVTDTIIKQLEKGIAPWIKPWQDKAGAFKLPINKVTGKLYNGINILLLWASGEQQGFKTNEWASFQQWKDKKEFVKKSEKGTMIIYYAVLEKPDSKKEEVRKIPFIKGSYVFNRAQLQSYRPEAETKQENNIVVNRIDVVETFVKNTGAIIEHWGQGACYIPSQDKIKMPHIYSFNDHAGCPREEAYYSALFHEVTHWTGHEKRLDRKLSTNFGSEPYAQEELVAELGSSYLAAEFEIEKAPIENHSNYIGGWLKKLKDDKHCIITASSHASKATAYLHSLQDQENNKERC